jgi:FkbM family methyltransferase
LGLQKRYKTAINSLAGLFGARVVSTNWGPRGVAETLVRARSRGFSPALVFDVGAYDGCWTRECRTIFPDCGYVLVDPLEANRAVLAAMAAADPRISVWHGIAAAQAGSLQLFEHADQSSVLASEDFRGVPRTVPATTVDALFAGRGSPAPVLLKADVQGYELEVLKGASGCLAHTEMLIVEVSFREIYENSALAHEIIAFLGERGFRIFDLCSYSQRAADLDLVQADLAFVHESSALLQRQTWS